MWQLTYDRDPFGRMVLVPAFGWYRFVCGVVVRTRLLARLGYSSSPS